MDIRQIERLMAAMEANGVTELRWAEGEASLSLTRRGEEIVLPAAAYVQAAPAAIAEPAAQEAPAGHKEILSPMVGTFHPAQGKAIKVGSKLKKGETLCVVEAMKLMNDIVMEEDGEIVFFALKDGDMVEFGQVIAQYK